MSKDKIGKKIKDLIAELQELDGESTIGIIAPAANNEYVTFTIHDVISKENIKKDDNYYSTLLEFDYYL